MKRFFSFIRILLTVFVLSGYIIIQPVYAAGEQAQAKYLVLIVIDSCRPDYLTLAPTPNIDSLKAEGISYTNSWVGQLNNDTPPGHTSISTGRFGKNSGVISFNWRDKRLLPADWDSKLAVSNAVMNFVKATGWTDLGLWYQQAVARKTIEENWVTTYENVVSGFFTGFIKESGSNSIGGLYKQKYPSARVVAISGDKWYACAGMAVDSADYTVFAEAKGAPPPTYNWLSMLKPAGLNDSPPPDYIMKDPGFTRNIHDERDSDTWAADVAVSVIEKTQPEILLINLPSVDDAGHASGGINAPEKMGEVISNTDKQIGRIVEACKKAGRYDETIFVVMSDHAMTPFIRTIGQDIIDRILIGEGNFANASPHIYLQYEEQVVDVAEKITDAGIPGLLGAYYKVKVAGDGYAYKATQATARKVNGDLDAAYQYLFSTYTSEKSPDIELILTENCHLDWTMFGAKPFKGNHDSATWLQQHNVLIISGPGVKRGTLSDSPARLVDVAPTVLTLMGITPQKMDGAVLADALLSPSDGQILAQEALYKQLKPFIEALKAQSEADLGELKK